jgi:cell division protein FtsA
MNEQASTYFVGLDIGTAFVRCVVGSLDPNSPNGLPSIVGHGISPNYGMRKGVVVHVDDVAEAIIGAVTEAERISGHRIHSATVNVNGVNVAGINSRGVIAISTANKEIGHDDLLRVEEAASIIQLPANREIIQAFTKNYSVDGQHNIKNPLGMQGVRLEADMHLVTAATPSLHGLDAALAKAQITARHHTVSSLAAAEAVLNRQQKEVGTLVVDIGAGTTNLAVIEDGEIQYIAVLPIGGTYVTNDLAIGLQVDLGVAEAVKLNYGKFVDKQTVKVRVDGHDYVFDIAKVQMIVEARIEELFEYVDKELQKIRRSRKLPGGVVITGASAQLPRITELSKEKMQLASRVGKLQSVQGLADTVDNPAYSTAVGLMWLDMLLGANNKESLQYTGGGNPLSILEVFWRRFKR